MRTGETHQHAAIVDPLVQPVDRLGDIADVGEDQHRQLLAEETVDRFGGADAFGESDIGERVERARQIIGRAEQRLRTVGGGAGDDADSAAAPALVEQLHGAGRTLADDFQSRHIVADFDRQVDHGFGLALAGLEGERRFAERQAFEVDGADDADVAAAGLCAQHFHGQSAGGIVGAGQSARRADTAFDDGERAVGDRALEAVDEGSASADIDAVGQPDEFDLGALFQKALDQRQRFGTIDAMRLRLDLLDLDARGAGDLQRDIARGFRQRQHGNAAVVGFGARDEFIGGAQPRIPGRGGGPAVVEQNQKRRGAARGRDRRIPQRSGGRDDHQRGQRQAQQRQPPRRMRRRLFLGRDVEQQPRRREVDALGPWRHQPQQPPQNRQAQQAEQDQRLREG